MKKRTLKQTLDFWVSERRDSGRVNKTETDSHLKSIKLDAEDDKKTKEVVAASHGNLHLLGIPVTR
jgi:hypothetical protein